MLSHKKGVVHFVLEWYNIAGDAFLESPVATAFLQDLIQSIEEDMQLYPLLAAEHSLLSNIYTSEKTMSLSTMFFGPAKFGYITANLDLFLRRFNEVQYWVVTEMLLVTNVSKRVQLLRKFIKLASQ
nr:hypothetical protein BaRGS_019300 [Batillaria attramentaria]